MEHRPQIGVMPKEIWENNRMCDLAECIMRHLMYHEPIKEEWVKEYNELAKKQVQL